MVDRSDILRCLRQQVAADRQFGVREVPFVLRSPAAKESAASVASGDRTTALEILDREQVRTCRKCRLAETRTRTVFGSGSATARLAFVGEAPGFEEDRQGLPFVGAAGDLLTRMIIAMNLSREDVFICNVLKCRPPENRDPAADEIAACSGYLFEQLSIVQPEAIVALGASAARTLLNTNESIGRLRGRFHDFHVSGSSTVGAPTPLMPTYHPAYLLRSPEQKNKTWADLQKVMALLGLRPRIR